MPPGAPRGESKVMMATTHFNNPIEPMTIANMRGSGVRSLAFRCHRCHSECTILHRLGSS
jgi:hypothetical protein